MPFWEFGQAASSRSKCRVCKKKIQKGQWRLGLSDEEHDHGGGPGCLGWFHVDLGCFVTAYQWNKKKVPITSLTSVPGFNLMDSDMRKTTTELFRGKRRRFFTPALLTEAQIAFTQSSHDDDIIVLGKSFQIKDALKSVGAKWDVDAKHWFFPAEMRDKVKTLFDLPPLSSIPSVPGPNAGQTEEKTSGQASILSMFSSSSAAKSTTSSATNGTEPAAKRRRVTRANATQEVDDAPQHDAFDNTIVAANLTVAALKFECAKRGIWCTQLKKSELVDVLQRDIDWRNENGDNLPLRGLKIYCYSDENVQNHVKKNGGQVMSFCTMDCDYAMTTYWKTTIEHQAIDIVRFRRQKSKYHWEPMMVGLPCIDLERNAKAGIDVTMKALQKANERAVAADLKPLESMTIEQFAERTTALLGAKWPPFLPPLEPPVERPKCKGGCGFFGDPKTGYCSQCAAKQ